MQRWARAWVLASLLGLPAVALAEATVQVELRGPDGKPADGKVILTKGEVSHACSTEQGKCDIPGVAGGLYQVRVEQKGKKPPEAKPVMIPPSGQVSLIVRGGA